MLLRAAAYGSERLTLALRGVSTTFRRFLGVNMVLTLSRPLSMLPNTGVRLLGVSIRCMSLSTDWDLVANRANLRVDIFGLKFEPYGNGKDGTRK